MAQKKMNIEDELRKIEQEERAIQVEEKRIEDKEDLLRMFEELGLMRWKSYYVLTAGAILLLSLTFVTALWTMHDQIVTLQDSIDDVAVQIDVLETKLTQTPVKTDWCPVGKSFTIPSGPTGSGAPDITANIIGKEKKDGIEVCHASATAEGKTVEMYLDEDGNVLEIIPQ